MGITLKRVAIAVLLYNGRLRSDVPGRKTGRTQFIKLRLIHSHSVSVDRRALETAGQGEDHARINTTREEGAYWHIRPQPFCHGLQEQPLESIHQRTPMIYHFLFA